MLSKAWPAKSTVLSPRSLGRPHKCSNLCASHTPTDRPLSSARPRQSSHCCQPETALLAALSFACAPARPPSPSPRVRPILFDLRSRAVRIGSTSRSAPTFTSSAFCRINRPKTTYVVLLRGTLQATLKPAATATCPLPVLTRPQLVLDTAHAVGS